MLHLFSFVVVVVAVVVVDNIVFFCQGYELSGEIALKNNHYYYYYYYYVTSQLQRIQNYAARVILRLPKSSSITIHLESLH